MTHFFDPDGMADEHRENDHDFDEPALRRLLHDAVRDIEPQPQALNRLRQAIPARRARRRQAMVGAAAGVLLVGTAVPVLVHTATGGGLDTANTTNASASQTIGTGRGGQGGNELGGDSGAAAGTLGSDSGASGATGGGKPSASASDASPGTGAAPSGTLAAALPLCARAQLGNGSAQTAVPDSQGRVYGSFTVLNTSNISCTVAGGDQITVAGEGGTDASKIRVVDHTAGDPATGLPGSAALPLILAPGKGYKVEFAWIPAAGGGTTGCSSDTGGGTTSGGTGGSSGSGATTTAGGTGTTGGSTTGSSGSTSTSSTSQNTPTDAGSPSATPAGGDAISLSDIPQQGGPAVASTSIGGACAGTVYSSEPVAATP
ncbi:hypothetical protein NGB36_28445 [Streptomyces sp. RB6PN25]|uniref:DUF4232 domain-containing protein n=1 Tax=Streptomyces humicola TaxID=2953240 RepID=A0ABT1Q3A1_9ACTN|nr:hypothetical protein [Streptomyces humicola]MCQ4084405.1 hypothetical protein [Streptomyces humicola]